MTRRLCRDILTSARPRRIMDRTVTLNRLSPVPLYSQLADQLKDAITEGALSKGTFLGNEIMLADRWQVSRPTVRRAIQDLVDEGLLVRRRGIGTQVVNDRGTTAVRTVEPVRRSRGRWSPADDVGAVDRDRPCIVRDRQGPGAPQGRSRRGAGAAAVGGLTATGGAAQLADRRCRHRTDRRGAGGPGPLRALAGQRRSPPLGEATARGPDRHRRRSGDAGHRSRGRR